MKQKQAVSSKQNLNKLRGSKSSLSKEGATSQPKGREEVETAIRTTLVEYLSRPANSPVNGNNPRLPDEYKTVGSKSLTGKLGMKPLEQAGTQSKGVSRIKNPTNRDYSDNTGKE